MLITLDHFLLKVRNLCFMVYHAKTSTVHFKGNFIPLATLTNVCWNGADGRVYAFLKCSESGSVLMFIKIFSELEEGAVNKIME